MPKRGGGRVGSRGGGHKSRGRGGYLGGKNRSVKKGRGGRRGGGRGGSRTATGAPGEFPELMDLDNPDFVSVSHPERTLKASAARRSRIRSRLQNEAFQTEDNIENTMKLPLRKRPVEFVKATTYDPSKDLIRKLKEKENYLKTIESKIEDSKPDEEEIPVDLPEEDVDMTDVTREEEDLNSTESDSVGNPVPHNPAEDEKSLEDEESLEDDESLEDEEFPEDDKSNEDNVTDVLDNIQLVVEETPVLVPASKLKPKPAIQQLSDDQLFFVDNEGTEAQDIRTVETVPLDKASTKAQGAGHNTEFTPTLAIGHVLLTTTEDSEGNQEAFLPRRGKPLKNLNSFDANPSNYELDDDEEDDELYIKNGSHSKDAYQSYQKYIDNVLKNVMGNSDDDEDDEDNYDGTSDEIGDDFEEEAKFIAHIDDSDDEATPGANNTADNLSMLKLDEQVESEDVEYGFHEEDYEAFDNSLVDIMKLRYGSASNQYFIRSFRFTGSYDFEWIDQNLFTDFLIENGMPEHRLSAYYRYIEAQITPPEVEEKDYDIEFSDSESEEEYNERQDPLSDSDSDEGLEDLIKYTTKYDGVRDQEFPTQSIKTKGKGKKKELVLDNIVDDDLRHALNQQYQIRRESKKQKKSDRESNIQKEHASSKDLSLKYPFSFHVKDIRNEFENFFLDVKRDALTFPPMDPHGIKTVAKFAYYYNMKSRKFGAGLKQHAVVIKNKRTFRSTPDYHSVGQLMRQRRVFNRIDQKRSRSEVEQEEAKSSRRGKPSKAHVQEGDIVGSNAPEISSDNVGRKLLIKMGWSVGQGLGAENRGIPEPVIAKVKKTKLGIR